MAGVGDFFGSVLQKIADIPNWILRLGNNYRTKSLIEVSQVSRVEPLTVVSQDLLNMDYTTEVSRSLLDLFIGYYLQAVALSSKVDGVRVTRILDRLNPDRQFNEMLLVAESHRDELTLRKEAYAFRLPSKRNRVAFEHDLARVEKSRYTYASEAHKSKFTLSREAEDHNGNWYPDSGLDAADKIHMVPEDQQTQMDRNGGIHAMDKDMITKVMDAQANLAVGKMIQVSIRVGDQGNQTVNVPITFRLATTSLSNQSITHLLANKAEDNSLIERYYAWRAGRISFIRDLILCQDMIDEHKKAIMTDKDGTFTEIMRRVTNSKKFGIISDNPSLVNASNLFIISEAVARDLENKLGGRLKDFKIREKAFDATYAMIIVVVDRDYERAIFYSRGIHAETNVSFKEMKKSNSNKGPDLMDVMNAFRAGQPPAL